MISLEKGSILPNKLPNNAGDLGKLIVAEGFKNLPKSSKSINLVTLGGNDVVSVIVTTTYLGIVLTLSHLGKYADRELLYGRRGLYDMGHRPQIFPSFYYKRSLKTLFNKIERNL